MRESFAIDRKKLYGFDYDNNEAAPRAQSEAETLLEEAAPEAAMDEAVEVVNEEAIEEVSAKEAFFEFARGVQVRPPHGPPRPGPTRPPRLPHHPPGPAHPAPPTPSQPGPGHDFNPNSGSAPRFAPPAHIPQRAPGLRAVDTGAISRCLYSNTYVWLNNGQQFWFFPTFIGKRSIAGYRWMHRHWVFMGFSLNMIDSFFCSGR